MTLPAFKAAGTGSETAPAWPTHASGDFGLLCVETTNATDNADVTTPSGWTALYSSNGIVANHTQLSVFYRFATSGAESAPTITGPNSFNHIWAVIVTYTGVNTSTPIHARATQPLIANATQWLPGVSTILDDCMIVQIACYNNDSAGPLFSGEANATLGSLTERYDAGTITNNGGGIYVVDGTLATHGYCDPTKVTMSTGGGLVCLSLALQAADKTDIKLGQKTRVVNTGM